MRKQFVYKFHRKLTAPRIQRIEQAAAAELDEFAKRVLPADSIDAALTTPRI